MSENEERIGSDDMLATAELALREISADVQSLATSDFEVVFLRLVDLRDRSKALSMQTQEIKSQLQKELDVAVSRLLDKARDAANATTKDSLVAAIEASSSAFLAYERLSRAETIDDTLTRISKSISDFLSLV